MNTSTVTAIEMSNKAAQMVSELQTIKQLEDQSQIAIENYTFAKNSNDLVTAMFWSAVKIECTKKLAMLD